LDPLRTAQLGAFAGAAVLASAVLRRRGEDIGTLVAAYIELSFVAAFLWSWPGRAEFAWLCLPALGLASKVSPRHGLQVGIVSGAMAAAAAFLALGTGGVSVPLLASAVGLPIVGAIAGRRPPPRPEPEPRDEELGIALENVEHAQQAERTARRAYREVVGLYRQLRGKYDELELDRRLAHAALSSEDPAERLLEVALEVAGAAGGSLWIADPSGGFLTVRSRLGRTLLQSERLATTQVESVAADLAAGGPEFAEKLICTSGRGQVEQVIREGGNIIGMLTLRTGATERLTTEPKRLADHLAAPLAHIRAEEALGRRLELAEARVRASDLIASTETTEAVGGRAIELLSRVVDAEHWSIFLLAPGGGPRRVIERGRPIDLPEALGLTGEAFTEWVSKDAVLHSGDAGADATMAAEKAVRLRVRSVLGIPLASGGKAVGAVFAAHSSQNLFTPHERSLLLRLSGPIARALELAEIRQRPLALVRLDSATGLHTYHEFSDRLRDEIARSEGELAVIRLRVGASADGERFEALGRSIAGAFAGRGFAAACGESEFIGCLPHVGRRQAQLVAELIKSRFADLNVTPSLAVLGKDGSTRHELVEATA
jgi:GGDEF domain-containing protein